MLELPQLAGSYVVSVLGLARVPGRLRARVVWILVAESAALPAGLALGPGGH
jgi:hypothetical protein